MTGAFSVVRRPSPSCLWVLSLPISYPAGSRLYSFPPHPLNRPPHDGTSPFTPKRRFLAHGLHYRCTKNQFGNFPPFRRRIRSFPGPTSLYFPRFDLFHLRTWKLYFEYTPPCYLPSTILPPDPFLGLRNFCPFLFLFAAVKDLILLTFRHFSTSQ